MERLSLIAAALKNLEEQLKEQSKVADAFAEASRVASGIDLYNGLASHARSMQAVRENATVIHELLAAELAKQPSEEQAPRWCPQCGTKATDWCATFKSKPTPPCAICGAAEGEAHDANAHRANARRV